MQNAAWKNDKSAFGFRMLQKMGWSEGKGLGKQEDGMTEHVKVRKRTDQMGLGSSAVEGKNGNTVLLGAVLDYNSMLLNLASNSKAAAAAKTKAAKAADSDDSDNSGDSDSSDDEQKSSCKRRGSKKEDTRTEGQAEAAAGSVKYIKRLAHHKVLKQKNVSAYSSSDLAAIFGTNTAFGMPGVVNDKARTAAHSGVVMPTTKVEMKRRRASSAGSAAEAGAAAVVDHAPVADKKAKKAKKDKKEKKGKKEKKSKKERKRKSSDADS